MEKPEIEYPVCNLCASAENTLIFADIELSDSGKRGIVKCSNCGLIYRNIRENKVSLRESYENKVYECLTKDWMQGRNNVFRPYLEQIERFRKTNMILDVGAGHGFFLAACKENGWVCRGIESSKQCRRFADQEFGITLENKGLEDTEYGNEFFDVVTFWKVLDHLPDPRSQLLTAHRMIRQGGALLVRCPNASFHIPVRKFLLILERIIPKLHLSNQTIFHLLSFDKQTLSKMLYQAGFKNVEILLANLSWTTTHNDRSSIIKTIISKAVGSIVYFVYKLTRRRVLFSPSMIVIASKSMDNHS